MSRVIELERMQDMWCGNYELQISGSLIKTARLKDEWYQDIKAPASFIEEVKEAFRLNGSKADIFTFWQRLPEISPKYNYQMEWDSIAAIPINTFGHWWEKQIGPTVRNMIRKAEKKGVEIRSVDYDDNFVRGITQIFNESPIRQGRPFLHYGKDFETVKKEFSRYLYREDVIAAYQGNQLIGFLMLANAGTYGDITQILSSIKHRDKSPTNALLARAVQLCEERKYSYLVYAAWLTGSLGEFKRHNGFERVDLPRYYVPLNVAGSLAVRLGVHKGLRGVLPDRTLERLKNIRNRWHLRTS